VDLTNVSSIFHLARKIANKQPNAISQMLKKPRTSKPKTSIKREIIKIRGKINEIDATKATKRINETKSRFFEKIRLWKI
jgi:hypothetical protein